MEENSCADTCMHYVTRKNTRIIFKANSEVLPLKISHTHIHIHKMHKLQPNLSTVFQVILSTSPLTLFDANIPNKPPRFFNLEADIVPLMVSCLTGGWVVGVVSPFCLGVLRSSNGISPGGVKPDLYRSMTTCESWRRSANA